MIFAFSRFLAAAVGSVVFAGCFADAHAADAEDFCSQFDLPATSGKPSLADPLGPKSKRAVLVGLKDYADPRLSFQGGQPERDVCAMRRLLIDRFAYKPADILLVVNDQADRAGILDALRTHLADWAKADTFSLFYYSGHGSQLPDDDGDEGDFHGLDETIVPYDSDALSGSRDIRDDELHALFTQIIGKGGEMAVIFDSCHSGDGARSGTFGKYAPRQFDIIGKNEHDSRIAFPFFSAAGATEVASERGARGLSLFTENLVLSLDRLDKPRSYADIAGEISAAIHATSFGVKGAVQNPRIDGDGRNRLFLGVQEVRTATAIAITNPYNQDPSIDITIDKGLLNGVTAGAVFDIYRPVSESQNADSSSQILEADYLGRAQVRDVSLEQSLAVLLDPFVPPTNARAILRGVSDAAQRTPILWTAGPAPRREALDAYFFEHPVAKIVNSGASQEDISVSADETGYRAVTATERLLCEGEPATFMPCLAQQAEVRRRFRLVSHESTQFSFDVNIDKYENESKCEAAINNIDKIAKTPVADDFLIAPGELLMLSVTNRTPSKRLVRLTAEERKGMEKGLPAGVYFYFYEFDLNKGEITYLAPRGKQSLISPSDGTSQPVTIGPSPCVKISPDLPMDHEVYMLVIAAAREINAPEYLADVQIGVKSRGEETTVIRLNDYATKTFKLHASR